MTDVPDLERDGGQVPEDRDLRDVLDVTFPVVLVVILSLALLKSRVPRIRPSEDVREFEFTEPFVVFGHGIDRMSSDGVKLAPFIVICHLSFVIVVGSTFF